MLFSRGYQFRNSVWGCLKKHHLSKRCVSSSAQPTTVDESKTHELGPSKKPYKKPFLLNVFAGKFDGDVLVYPEVVDLDELQRRTIENGIDLSVITEQEESRISVQEKVANIFKSNVPIVSDSEWKDSERMKMYEMLDLDLQTALIMETQSMMINLLKKYGSADLQSKYLKKLITGEIRAAFAMSESATGSDPSSLETIAEFDEDSSTYCISGSKEWVTNGKNADVFVVFAVDEPVHGQPRGEVSAFMIEKNSPGISIIDHPSRDLRDCGLVKITFEKTPVRQSSILGDIGSGFEIAAHFITHNRYFVLTSLLNTLKKTVVDVQKCVLSRKQFPVALKDCELVQYKLSQVSTSMYAMESLMYLYAGMLDSYDIDMTTDSAALQLYCYNAAVDCMRICNEILGGKSYDGDQRYMTLLSEMQGLILASKTQSILQLYVAMMGLRHAGMWMQETVMKNRNPLNYPGFAFRRLITNSRHDRDAPKLTLELYMNLHPSLKSSCEILEYAVLRVQFAVEIMFTRYGNDVINKQTDLCRIAEVVSLIFAMTAILGRASRSYCTGIRFADAEVLHANAFCLDAIHQIRHKISQVVDGGTISNDVGRLKIGTDFLENGSYFIEHPLVRNIK